MVVIFIFSFIFWEFIWRLGTHSLLQLLLRADLLAVRRHDDHDVAQVDDAGPRRAWNRGRRTPQGYHQAHIIGAGFAVGGLMYLILAAVKAPTLFFSVS